MSEEQGNEKRSYWCVFYDDIMLLFFLSAAITFALYTVWGLMELGTAQVSPLVTAQSEAGGGEASAVAAPTAKAGYWESWPRGTVGQFPPCGTNVIALGLDEILQATVDIYCGLDPGAYETKINPAVMDIYKARGDTYPDGITGILLLPKLGVGFVTEHRGGNPIFDAITLADGKSIKSADVGHPLNPETCHKCHREFGGVCVGFVCGNRND